MIPKISGPKEYAVGEKLHIDISSIKTTSFEGSKLWLLIVDEKSNYCWTHFLKQKSEVASLMTNFVKNLCESGRMVKSIQCDYAGENKSFQ
jgi:hypothetical protein